MDPAGTWDLSISTPIGAIKAVVDLYEKAGTWRGTARGAGAEIPLRDVTLAENRLTWQQRITKPMRLNLTFDVVLDGDSMTGTSKRSRHQAHVLSRRHTSENWCATSTVRV